MKPMSIDVVPALPGYYTIYNHENKKVIELGEPAIAWRIETFLKDSGGELFSSSIPLTADGEAASNCIGVQYPDMTGSTFDETLYRSLKELQEAKYPKS